ncbi:MAG: metal-dependent hydrolase [Gemmatimonadales bacterium]
MFIGHFAVGMAGKKFAPGASLPSLWLAAMFADILWPILIAIGAEQVRIVPGNTAYTPLDFVSYPWSHSLLMLIVWGALFAAFFRNEPGGKRIGLVLGSLVVSHWVLDWITHRPDMPLWPYGPKFGLGLWENIPATMAVELTMFAVGVWMYLKSTWERDEIGKWGFWAVILFLFVAYVFDSFNRNPPGSVGFLWVSTLVVMAFMLGLAVWIENHRDPRYDAEGNLRRRRVRVDLK